MLKPSKLFEPLPAIYKLDPVKAGVIGIAGLYGAVQAFRTLVEGKSFFSEVVVVMIGDPLLGAFIASAASALQEYKPTQPRFFHKFSWYATIAGLACIGNLINESINVIKDHPGIQHDLRAFLLRTAQNMVGIDKKGMWQPGLLYHVLMMPIFAALIIGVFPHLLETKGHRLEKFICALAILIYGICFLLDAMKAQSMQQ
jgi:hypothetical protein